MVNTDTWCTQTANSSVGKFRHALLVCTHENAVNPSHLTASQDQRITHKTNTGGPATTTTSGEIRPPTHGERLSHGERPTVSASNLKQETTLGASASQAGAKSTVVMFFEKYMFYVFPYEYQVHIYIFVTF